MDQQIKQGYRMHQVLSNLNSIEVNQLDDVDQERIETATALLEEVSLLTQSESGEAADVRAES